MDMQAYLDNALAADRKKTLAKSDQLTLGELILKFESLPGREEGHKDANVVFDFEYLHPTDIGSWRGSYNELALGFDVKGDAMKIADFLGMLKKTIGETLTGYKGGDYLMSKHTPIWVANYGNAGSKAVIDVVDNRYEIILITGIREY